MERIDQQQLSKKPIPAICEEQAKTRPDDTADASCSWLSSAMALWLNDDDTRRLARPQSTQPPGTC